MPIRYIYTQALTQIRKINNAIIITESLLEYLSHAQIHRCRNFQQKKVCTTYALGMLAERYLVRDELLLHEFDRNSAV